MFSVNPSEVFQNPDNAKALLSAHIQSETSDVLQISNRTTAFLRALIDIGDAKAG